MTDNGAGIIIYKLGRDGKPEYLIVRAKWGYKWSFPKGHKQSSEGALSTALRETEEETGIASDEIRIVDGFEEIVQYKLKAPTKNCPEGTKRVRFFLGKVKAGTEVTLSKEHTEFRWVPPFVALAYLPAHYNDIVPIASRVIAAEW